LGDRAIHRAGADRVLLLLARIVTDDDDLLAAFLDADRNALGRTFIGAEDALQVRMRLQHGLGQFRGGAVTILGTIIGAFIMSVLTNGLRIMSVAQEWQFTVTGIIIIVAVYADMLRRGLAAAFRP
jgi:ribose transport system permease protein